MRLATWNVNSIRIRLDRLLRFLERSKPDVVCLQELKSEEGSFPFAPLKSAGYEALVLGQKTYNGVAILARTLPEEVGRGFEDGSDDPQARFLAARIGGTTVASVYVPNGSEVGSEKWAYKLDWMAGLRGWLDRRAGPDAPLALCGDFNVAPDERDVCDPKAWASTVLFHPEARRALARVTEFGLEDVFRRHHTEAGLYTWWDYRMLGFPKNQGLRIDHVLATAPLAVRSVSATIDRDERKGEQPSDHAPVLVDFSD